MKRLGEQTLYEILEVPADAPDAEIRAACERAREIYGAGSLVTYTLRTAEEAAFLERRIDCRGGKGVGRPTRGSSSCRASAKRRRGTGSARFRERSLSRWS